MSRNLCATRCARCGGSVALVGPATNLPADHFACPNMLAADADCTECGARYTAWIGPMHDTYGGRDMDLHLVRELGFYDLSYRSTFNDEPGTDDLSSAGDNRFLEITRAVARSS